MAAQHKYGQCCLELMAAGADPGRLDEANRKPGDVHRVSAKNKVAEASINNGVKEIARGPVRQARLT